MKPIGEVIIEKCENSYLKIEQVHCHYQNPILTCMLDVCLTNTSHIWPLSIEGSLACHIYCDTGFQFIMVIFEDPLH